MKDEEGSGWRSEWKGLEFGETREDGRGKGVEWIVTKVWKSDCYEREMEMVGWMKGQEEK